MTPAHPPRRKGSVARSWKAWAIVGDRYMHVCSPDESKPRISDAYLGVLKVIRVDIIEQRPGSRRGGRKGKRK